MVGSRSFYDRPDRTLPWISCLSLNTLGKWNDLLISLESASDDLLVSKSRQAISVSKNLASLLGNVAAAFGFVLTELGIKFGAAPYHELG